MDQTKSPNIITNASNLISNVVNQFIVRPTGVPNLIGISGFVFDVTDNEEFIIDSDITDHYVEDNFAVQDHIALRPVRITLKGYVAELNDLFPQALGKVITAAQSIGRIAGFLPQFTFQATQEYQKMSIPGNAFNSVVKQAENAYALFKQFNTSSARQQNAYNFFYSMWGSRQLCVVETPWNIFYDMAIESIRILQGGQTRYISDFTITFKQIRTVSSKILVGNVNSDNPEGSGAVSGLPRTVDDRLKSMIDPLNYQGTTLGQTVDDNVSVDVGLIGKAFANGIF